MMNCPRCETPLKEETLKDLSCSIQVDNCPNCCGTWFDKNELKQIENIVELAIIEIRKIPNKKDQFNKLCCPSCNLHPKMNKVEHARDKKVIIDHCPICEGIWLDSGELNAIQKDNVVKTIAKVFRLLVK